MAERNRLSEKRRSWDEWFELAKQYRAEHGDLLIPRDYVSDDGALVGRWVERMRAIYNGKRSGALYADQITALEQIGMVWKLENRFSWESWMELCREYRDNYGDLLVPRSWAKGDMKLGEWINNARKSYLQGELSEQQIQDLSRLGMEWVVLTYRSWEDWYADAKAFFAREGHFQIPKPYVTEDGDPLGRWLSTQRELYHGKIGCNVMPQERVRLLEAIGMEWDGNQQRERDWLEMYRYVTEYRAENGVLPISRSCTRAPNGKSMSYWITRQRSRLRIGNLSVTQRQQLRDIGILTETTEIRQASSANSD